METEPYNPQGKLESEFTQHAEEKRYSALTWDMADLRRELATKDELHSAALQVLERHHKKQLATLVDALKECRVKLDWSVCDGEFIDKIDAALAKMKEGK